jgi:preprotein translocase subunit YajC
MTNFFSNIFTSDAIAQTTSGAAAGASSTGFMNFMPLILICLVFYFLLIRPQQKKAKEHQNTLNALKNGDKVRTNGGIFGVIKSVDSKEDSVELEIAENVVIKVLKQGISDVVNDASKNKELRSKTLGSKTTKSKSLKNKDFKTITK